MMEDTAVANNADNSNDNIDDTVGKRRTNNVDGRAGLNDLEGDLEGGRRRPRRVVIDMPDWMPQLPVSAQRGLRLLLMAMAVVAAVGSVLLAHKTLSSYSSGNGGETTTTIAALSKNDMEGIVLHSTMDPHSYGKAPAVAHHSGSPLLRPESARFADVATPFDPLKEVPLFLHVPRSSGTTIMGIMGQCMGLVQVTQAGGHGSENAHTGSSGGESTMSVPLKRTKIGQVLNVDTYSPEGLLAAREGHLMDDNRFHVLDSPIPYDAARILFHPTDASDKRSSLRPFILLRHPVERSISYFYHIQNSLPKGTTLTAYAKSADRPEFNYLTKLLSGRPLATPSQDLTQDDVDRAKEFLRRKVLVGTTANRKASFHRLMCYFGWTISNASRMCTEELNEWYDSEDNDKTEIKPEDERWALVLRRNLHDMDLYEYAAKKLVHEQAINSRCQ